MKLRSDAYGIFGALYIFALNVRIEQIRDELRRQREESDARWMRRNGLIPPPTPGGDDA